MKDLLFYKGKESIKLRQFAKLYEKDINRALKELTKHAAFIRNVRIKIILPEGTGRIDIQALCDEQKILGTAGNVYNKSNVTKNRSSKLNPPTTSSHR